MPLQKSFSDSNHSNRPHNDRNKLNRHKSFQGPQAAKPNPQLRPLQEKPPLPVSTSTKNKLNAFQFQGQVVAGEGEKPQVINVISSGEKENHCVQDTILQPIAENAVSSKTPVLEQGSNSFPSTPAGRLALPDLINMGDIQREVQDVSPEDRIEWDLRSSGSTHYIRKANKRARSSSPVSSPAAQASAHFNSRGESVNIQIDSGSELWGRYSLNGSNAPTPQGATIPALANIMFTSSPQTARNGTPRSGIARRTTSCGNSFPKRRRINSSQKEEVVVEPANIGPSKLSVLIEKVQQGMIKPHLTPDMKRASSDSTTNSMESRTPSRLMQKGAATHPQLAPPKLAKVEPSPGSDYGEFDDELLNDKILLECFTQKQDECGLPRTKQPTIPPRPAPPIFRSSLPPRSPPNPLSRSHHVRKEAVQEAKPPKDEFDDSDEDEFAASLDKMVASFSQSISHKAELAASQPPSQRIPQRSASVATDSDDEFGDGGVDIEDFQVALHQSAQQKASKNILPSIQKARAIQRYQVVHIFDTEYEALKGRLQPEKVLIVQCGDNKKGNRVVSLRGTWFETPVTIGAYVHVLGSFDNNGRCIIDDENYMIILHPDHLISSTVVADSFGCTRRAVLQDRVKATSANSPPLIYGIILHEIFQASMLEDRWDTEWLNEQIDSIAAKHIEHLYTIQLQVSQAVEYLRSKMSEMQSWAELFVATKPHPDALVQTGNGETAKMCVSKLLDVEEHVWSPMYGLKGNIDATVQVTVHDRKKDVKPRTLTVPFEVKTGKNPSPAHRAQTALYNLLLADRYDVEIAYGILYYMETSETIRIPAIRHELRHMIMQRNELACFARERHAHLPPMLKKENMCNRCYAKTSCFIYHKLADDGTGETSGVKDKFDEAVKHLTPKHKEFFMKWDNLLTKEEKECLKFRRELWTMLSSEREELGRCFSNVIIEPGSAYEEKNSPKINRYRYNLIKESPSAEFSFLDSQLNVGEPIVISDEMGHFALANGYVTHVRKKRITVAVDRRLHNARIRQPGFDEYDNQVFASIMEVAPEGATEEQSSGKIVEKPVQYRLDKDEFSNGLATVRNNLIQVMAEGPFGSREIRSLVVDLKEPRFKLQSTAYTLKGGENINVDQRRAIDKVMGARDYALVLGMPGTGKTTTIAHIIRALVSQGKSVLLTSYTHTAVDNILLKLKHDDIPILRLGIMSKIHPEVQKFATLAATAKTSFEEIRSAWHDSPIVATTCLGTNHAIFNERTFDYCIVDEASQITLPVCLGPIRLARRFILVGDHYQLPPLVQNEEARKGGLDISLFKHLSDEHPSSVVYLEHQYRMCEDVMTLSNNLIYSGRLKCGTQEVADRRMIIPNMDGLWNHHHHNPSTMSRSTMAICAAPVPSQCWIRDLLDPEMRVSFINTDPLLPGSREVARGKRILNNTESSICAQLVESLLSVGVPATDIGVMTHYRSQLKLLKDSLRAYSGVEMDTADRFQGRDKEVIIISLVRSNEARAIGELLKDWRRINVAFTRAKTKLLVIGSRETLKGNENNDGSKEMVAQFVGLMETKGWVYDLPPGALDRHVFDNGATQVTATQWTAPPGSQWAPIKFEESGKRKPLGAIKDHNVKLNVTKECNKRSAFGDAKTNYSSVKVEDEHDRKILGDVSGNRALDTKKMGPKSGNVTGKNGRKEPHRKITGQKSFKQPVPKADAADVLNDLVF